MNRLTFFVRAGLIAQALVVMIVMSLSLPAWSLDPPPMSQPPAPGGAVNPAAPKIEHRVMESYPNRYQARMEQRNRTLQRLTSPHAGMAPQFILDLSKRWNVGQTITVAFRGGNEALHKDIATTVNEWTQYANLKFDFGVTAAGKYRTWSKSDKQFAADIRVSFDQEGYYSLVGTDSNNPMITHPNEESLNLNGFDTQRPNDWKGVALHEFGHAIGFQHEHQSPVAPCDFRFADDANYVPTTDEFGQYIPDPQGRRPGLYTVLGGPPNNWPKAVVDFNLKPLPTSSAYEVGPFDKDSIMKYVFPAWMFTQGENSHCFTPSENLVISAGDKIGAGKVYPMAAPAIAAASALRLQAVETISKTPGLAPATEKHFQDRLKMMKDK